MRAAELFARRMRIAVRQLVAVHVNVCGRLLGLATVSFSFTELTHLIWVLVFLA